MNWYTETIETDEYADETTWSNRDSECIAGLNQLADESNKKINEMTDDDWDGWMRSAGEAGDMITCRMIEWGYERGLI